MDLANKLQRVFRERDRVDDDIASFARQLSASGVDEKYAGLFEQAARESRASTTELKRLYADMVDELNATQLVTTGILQRRINRLDVVE